MLRRLLFLGKELLSSVFALFRGSPTRNILRKSVMEMKLKKRYTIVSVVLAALSLALSFQPVILEMNGIGYLGHISTIICSSIALCFIILSLYFHEKAEKI